MNNFENSFFEKYIFSEKVKKICFDLGLCTIVYIAFFNYLNNFIYLGLVDVYRVSFLKYFLPSPFYLTIAFVTSNIVGTILCYFVFFISQNIKINYNVKLENKRVDAVCFFNFLILAVCLFLVLNFLVFLICLIFGQNFFALKTNEISIDKSFFLNMIAWVIVIPAFQSLFYNGLIFGYLKRFGLFFAVFIQAFVYALTYKNLIDFIIMFTVSVFLAYVYALTQNFTLVLFSKIIISFFNVLLILLNNLQSLSFTIVLFCSLTFLILIISISSVVYIYTDIKIDDKIFSKFNLPLSALDSIKIFFSSSTVILSIFLFVYKVALW